MLLRTTRAAHKVSPFVSTLHMDGTFLAALILLKHVVLPFYVGTVFYNMRVELLDVDFLKNRSLVTGFLSR